MFDAITNDRILQMTDQEKRWFDNVKKAFYHSDKQMNRGVPEDRCLEEIFKAIDTAKTLRRSLRGESTSPKQNKKRFIEFLAFEIPSVKSREPKLELKEVESGQLRQYALGDIIYTIRCKVHENENLNYTENVNYHILLNWSKGDTRSMGEIEGGRFVCNGYFLWNRLREILAKFITYIDSAFSLAKEQSFSCTVRPRICSIKHSKNRGNKLMAKKKKIEVDVSAMDKDALLKLFETEWQDHFQTRRQTWKALEIAALLTVAIVGVQWQAPLALVKIVSSVLLIGVSLFGMQITFRHRNFVEETKFTIISEIEKHLNFKASGLGIPKPITLLDIIKLWKSNTSLFLLRMQGIILILGIIMLAYSI